MTKKPEDNGLFPVRFGLISIRKGFVTQEQLIKALEIQVLEEIEFGTHRKVGEILSSQDIISTDEIGEVLRDISRGVYI